MASLSPAHGARIVLERDAVEEGGARYRVTVHEPGGVSHRAAARVGATISVGEWSGEPPAWTRAFVDRLLRTLASKHADGSWPRKITRWRSSSR